MFNLSSHILKESVTSPSLYTYDDVDGRLHKYVLQLPSKNYINMLHTLLGGTLNVTNNTLTECIIGL